MKRQIEGNELLRKKAVSYIFLSTSEDEGVWPKLMIFGAGIFGKPFVFEELLSTIKYITGYWNLCRHPKVR